MVLAPVNAGNGEIVSTGKDVGEKDAIMMIGAAQSRHHMHHFGISGRQVVARPQGIQHEYSYPPAGLGLWVHMEEVPTFHCT